MIHYENYYWGMNFIWWIIWVLLLFWIFAVPYNIPGQRNLKETPLDILKKRYASGKIDIKEFNEKKQILDQS
ncbi:SHOCT domain-containing protein [Flavobacterium sp. FlaQc-48]|uniref:SHOCT domain-containing protein n=1 Tax=Flavobacterium sp. FlaQc-48 TaxID=3374181 RepID=UPI0037564574